MHLFYHLSAFLLFAPIVTFAQLNFADKGAELGVNQYGKNYGIAIADFNNDGWDDVFAARQELPCQLYQNNGDGSFSEVSSLAGVDYSGTPTCVAWADIDNDGWLDLFVGSREGNNLLFRNNGDGSFSDIAESAGILEGGAVKAVLFSDVDMDGFIDIYIVRFLMENILLKNNGDLTFSDITDWSNASDVGLSMGALFFDYDHDGDPDLYLTRDGNQTFILYQNLGNGKFVDSSIQSGTNINPMGMGVDVGDVNNDGWLDIYVTNLYYNSLLINDGSQGFFGPSFDEIAADAGVDDTGMGWGTCFLDFDNDGWQDIYMVNDSYYSPMPNLLYRNNGDNTFDSLSHDSPVSSMEPSYGAACGDFNNDGKVDILVSNWNGDVGNQLFLNETENENNWVKIKAIGTVSNRAAIGAKVTVEFNGQVQSDEIISGCSYASQNSLTLHFGLGEAEEVDKITVRWPNGLVEEYLDLLVNTTYCLTEGEGFTTSVHEIEDSPFELQVAPNPFSDELKVQLISEAGGEMVFSVYDDLGKLVVDPIYRQIYTGSNQIDIDGRQLVSGMYYLNVKFRDRVKTYQVIKR